MKFCQKCGTALSDSAAFCPSCGQKQADPTQQPRMQAQPSDPSLTRNIALISVYALLTLITIIPASVGGDIGIGSFIMVLCISALLAFFAIRPSDDHIDTDKMNLLKTVESFGVSILYLFCACFSVDAIFTLVYLAFVLGFSVLTAVKISRINLAERNATEKVLLAFSIVLIGISSLAAFVCLRLLN